MSEYKHNEKIEIMPESAFHPDSILGKARDAVQETKGWADEAGVALEKVTAEERQLIGKIASRSSETAEEHMRTKGALELLQSGRLQQAKDRRKAFFEGFRGAEIRYDRELANYQLTVREFNERAWWMFEDQRNQMVDNVARLIAPAEVKFV